MPTRSTRWSLSSESSSSDHYMNGAPYRKIGKRIAYDERTVRRIANRAVMKLAGIE